MDSDLYEILQVSPRAEPEVIESAYRRLAQKYHPDHNTQADAVERMKALNEAYAVLRDPAQRARYDSRRGMTGQSGFAPRRRPVPQYQPPVSHAPSRPAPQPQRPPQKPSQRPPQTPPQAPPQGPNPAGEAAPGLYRDVFVSEALVTDAVEMLKTRPTLSVDLIEHTMGIGTPRAERLLKVLFVRGFVDAAGNRVEKTGGKGEAGKELSEQEKLEGLVPEALKLLRNEKALTVQLLYQSLGIGFTQAIALFSLLREQQIIETDGRPTATTKARLATKDLGPIFGCPFCDDSMVHHYQTVKRFMPDAHFFKCPKCFAEFEPDNHRYKLVLVPTKYGARAEVYRDRSYTPAQWQAVGQAEKNRK